MKKLLTLVLALAGTLTLWAYSPAVNDIRISVRLNEDGSARITEVWDVVVASGTEWYLVRSNLGDINILDLQVVDEQGNAFFNEGSWDVDRSIGQKARKCGLHRTGSGYEICWGVESYGPHTWTVSYTMTNVVKTLNDYDMVHMQFISDDLSSPPQHAILNLETPVSLSEDNSRIWAFGYTGTVNWQGGNVCAESSEPFNRKSSMILLVRFDKGIFASPSVQDREFEAVLTRAQEGATYDDEEEESDPLASLIASLFSMLVMWWVFIKPALRAFGVLKKKDRSRVKEIFGRRHLPAFPGWSRDIPFDGNHLRTYYIASHMKGNDNGKLTIVSAIILRMIGNGNIRMKADTTGKNEFSFVPGASREWMSEAERDFYKMLEKAAGKDKILQQKEFKKWASSNRREVYDWVKDIKEEVLDAFSDPAIASESTYYESIELTPAGQEKAMQAIQFRQFLQEFTIINERHVPEVALWGDYLIVAALFGMADKVASDMKRLAPDIKIGDVKLPTNNLGDLVVFSNAFSNYARSANSLYAASTGSGGGYSGGSSGGFGGSSSFGGGGGFSGGGSGGGSR